MGKRQAHTGSQPQSKQDVKMKQKQQQQRQMQPRTERPVGGMQHYTSYLQVLALDIDHTSPSVMLVFNRERYLFNAGEGIQRLFREHRLKIKAVSSYFITRISTETLGGLPGMALSVTPADAGGLLDKQAACTVKGPPGLASYVSAFRGYINQENTVAVEEIDHNTSGPVVKTDVVSITPILVRMKGGGEGRGSPAANGHKQPGSPSRSGGSEGGNSPWAKRQRTEPVQPAGNLQREEQGEEGAQGRQRPAGLSHPDLVVYAVQLAGRPGKFMPAKAVELGVQSGPMFGELQRGNSVTTASGRLVTPSEVMEPAVPGPSLLLLDTPHPDYLAAVAADETVRRYVTEAASRGGDGAGDAVDRVCIAVHMASPAVVADHDGMAAWQAQLGPVWRHVLVTSGAHQPSSIPRATVFQSKLHCLSPTCFPIFALGNAVAPPPLPEAELEAAAEAMAAAARETAAKEAATKQAAAGKGKGKGGKGGGGGGDGGGGGAGDAPAPAAAAAAPAAPGLRAGSSNGGAAAEVEGSPAKQAVAKDVPDIAASTSEAPTNDAPAKEAPTNEAPVQEAATKEALAKEAPAGNGKGRKGGGGAPPRAASAAATAPALPGGGSGGTAVLQQQPPVLPMEPVVTAMSAVRVNLMPPARQGLEYSDVFRYDSSSKVLEDMRANLACAEVLAAAAEVHEAAAGVHEAAAGVHEAAAAETAGEAGDVDMEVGARAAVDEIPAPLAGGDRRMAELTFLGTASSQPSKYRNVSGCYVDLYDKGGLLVDCGEDAMGQLKRRYGSAEAERRLLDLGMVWVSHMHADHHGGLYRLLEWRARRGAQPLLVVGPGKLFDILLRYSAAVPIQFVFIRNIALSRPDSTRPPPLVAVEALEEVKARLGLAALAPFPVDHIFDSHGLRLEGAAGWKVVFSADTRPCEQTIAAAQGATLLVHEATFEESMVGEARAKKHSTTAEAVSVGERAGAYRTVLTHFSTRYPTLPDLDLSPHPSVAVAMDLMAINLADLPWLPRLVRPMGMLFKQLEEEKLADAEEDE